MKTIVNHGQSIEGDADADHSQNIGGDAVKLLKRIYPPHALPGFRHLWFRVQRKCTF